MSTVIGRNQRWLGPPGSSQCTEERQKQSIHFCTESPVHIVKGKWTVPSALVRKSLGYRCKKQFRWTGFILYLIMCTRKKVIGQLAGVSPILSLSGSSGTELRFPDLVKTVLAYRAISLAQDWLCTRCSEFIMNATRVCQTPV